MYLKSSYRINVAAIKVETNLSGLHVVLKKIKRNLKYTVVRISYKLEKVWDLGLLDFPIKY